MMHDAPWDGSNNPPLSLDDILTPATIAALLADRFASRERRKDELLASFRKFEAVAAGGITDEATDGRAIDLVRLLKACVAATDETRVAVKAPVLAAARQIDDYAREITEPLARGAIAAEAKSRAYRAAVVAHEKAAREAAAARAAAEAHAAAEVARAASGEADPDSQAEAQREAAAAQEAAAAAQAAAAATVTDLSRRHTATGGVSSLRSNWQARVINLPALLRAVLIGTASQGICPCCGIRIKKLPEDWQSAPPGFIAANEAALRLAAKAAKGAGAPPGVEYYDAGGMTIR